MRIVIDATRAIPRSRLVLLPAEAVRRLTSNHEGCPRRVFERGGGRRARAGPGTSSVDPSNPGFTASSSPIGAVPFGYPTDAMSRPSRTIAATAASSASAARSTALVAADASLSAAETAATNSASCCVDQPDVPIQPRKNEEAPPKPPNVRTPATLLSPFAGCAGPVPAHHIPGLHTEPSARHQAIERPHAGAFPLWNNRDAGAGRPA